MFGYSKPHPAPEGYRAFYARLCQHHRGHHGLRTAPAHSYEAVFLFALAGDLGLFDRDALPETGCCHLRSLPREIPKTERAVGEFCSRVGMLLAGVKLDDDVADDHSFSARIVSRWWRKPIREARDYFQSIDPVFVTRMRAIFVKQHEIEQRSSGKITLQEAIEPTADAFGYVFGLLSEVAGRDDLRNLLVETGRDLGGAIVTFDMVSDLESDRRRGAYNPLIASKASDLRNAARASLSHLVSAHERIQSVLPGSVSGSILAQVAEQTRAWLDSATDKRHGVSDGNGEISFREPGLVYSDAGGCLCLCLGILACGGLVGACNKGEVVKVEKDWWGNTTLRKKGPCEC